MTKVVDALKKLGIADKDIQTTTISLQPVYDYSTNTNPPRLTGYQLNNAVAVTVRDLDKVGDAIDGSLAAGATTFDGVTFRVEDPAKAEQQAREAAMAQAKSKAETLAKGAGVAIGGVASISETASPVPYPVYYARDAAGVAAPDKSTPTPVETGTNEVTVTRRGELPDPVVRGTASVIPTGARAGVGRRSRLPPSSSRLGRSRAATARRRSGTGRPSARSVRYRRPASSSPKDEIVRPDVEHEPGGLRRRPSPASSAQMLPVHESPKR